MLLLLFVPEARGTDHSIDMDGSTTDYIALDHAWRDQYHGHYSAAIARLDRLIANSPDFALAYYERAVYERDAGRYAEALADIGKVEVFHPDESDVWYLRATIALCQHDPRTALADLQEVARKPWITTWKQTTYVRTVHGRSALMALLSVTEEMLGQNEAAFEDFKNELVFETDNPQYVLATHCWFATMGNQLGMAELTCGEAIARQSSDHGAYDTLGLAYLKMKKWAESVRSYDLSLRDRPDFTLSLYGRGIARRASGDVAGGMADIAAARQGEPDIDRIMAKLGIKPV